MATLFNVLVVVTGIFLIGVVLIQRGKGGGLAGAFGGVGGSSPFGSKAGDAFTKFTGYVFLVWLAFILVQVKIMNRKPDTGSSLSTTVPTTNQ